MEKLLVIKVIGKEVETEKNTFVAFNAVQKDGKLINVGFRKDVENAPKKVGTYNLTVESTKMNIDSNRTFPKLWIKEIVKVEKLEKTVDKKVLELFDTDEEETKEKEDLPF